MLGCLDQLLDLVNGQVLPCPDVSIFGSAAFDPKRTSVRLTGPQALVRIETPEVNVLL
jgi:hypothetical protein